MDGIIERIRKRLAQRRPRALVVGDLMLDRYLWGRCERVSPEAPVQVVDVYEQSLALGGGGNVAANLVALGAEVEVASAIGGDERRTVLLGLCAELGLGTDNLVIEQGRPITEKTRIVAAHQQVVRYDLESRVPLAAETEARLIERGMEAAGAADVVVLSDYGKGVLTEGLCRALIGRARELGLPVLCDPKGRDWAKYARATLLTPNKKEAAELTRTSLADAASLERAGALLRAEYQAEHVLITLGEEGMALFGPEGLEHIPTLAREVFDVTGAGDTVIATVAFALGCGVAMSDACRFANAAAGVVVGKMGTAAVTLDEIAHSTQILRSSPSAKIVERTLLVERCEQLRRRGRRVVFTNGCFDLLHLGHVKLLEEAAGMGDVLVVGLNTDASVGRIKPGRPINPERDRAYLLAALGCVDYVVLFDENTPRDLIAALRPDVLVKGGDYAEEDIVGADIVRGRGGVVRTVPLLAGRSTTGLLARVRETSS